MPEATLIATMRCLLQPSVLQVRPQVPLKHKLICRGVRLNKVFDLFSIMHTTQHVLIPPNALPRLMNKGSLVQQHLAMIAASRLCTVLQLPADSAS